MICLLIGWVWPFFPSMWVNLYIWYHPWKAYHIIPPFGAAAVYFYITIRYPQSSPPSAQVPQMPSQGVGPTLGSAFTQKNQLLADSKHSMAVSGPDLLDLAKNKAVLQGPYSKQQNMAWRSYGLNYGDCLKRGCPQIRYVWSINFMNNCHFRVVYPTIQTPVCWCRKG